MPMKSFEPPLQGMSLEGPEPNLSTSKTAARIYVEQWPKAARPKKHWISYGISMGFPGKTWVSTKK